MNPAKERVLLVDDDPVALTNYRRLLRGMCEMDTFTTADAALNALAVPDRRYAVIVVEALLPDMKGLDLLRETLRLAPKAQRIVVTVSTDAKTITDALNEIGVIRYLLKPASPDAFVAALREGLHRFIRTRTDRALREQAYNGIIQLLTGYFDSTEPEISGQAKLMRDRARAVAQSLRLPSTAELELGVLLMRLGVATIPKHTRDKLHAHEKLQPEELDLIDRIPEVAAHLLDHNKRLGGVAEIIRYDEAGAAADRAGGSARERVSLAARILRPIVDLQILENTGLTTAGALLRLRQDLSRYDRDVIKTLEQLSIDPEAVSRDQMEDVMVEALVSGMVLAADALSDEGVPLISRGTELIPAHIEHLRSFAELGEVVEPLHVRRTTSHA